MTCDDSDAGPLTVASKECSTATPPIATLESPHHRPPRRINMNKNQFYYSKCAEIAQKVRTSLKFYSKSDVKLLAP